MASQVSCPACNKIYSLTENQYGKKVNCDCGESFEISDTGELNLNVTNSPEAKPQKVRQIICPNCEEKIPMDSRKCPVCEEQLETDERRSRPTNTRRRQNIGNEEKTSALAIWSLVLGCVSVIFCLLTSIPAIITGHMALSKIKHSKGRLGGRGLALGGMIVGYVFTLLLVIYIIFVGVIAAVAVPNLMDAQRYAKERGAIGNLKTLMGDQATYQADNDTYATLEELASNNKIDLTFPVSGYEAKELFTPTSDLFAVIMSPIAFGSTGKKHFIATSAGSIRVITTVVPPWDSLPATQESIDLINSLDMAK